MITVFLRLSFLKKRADFRFGLPKFIASDGESFLDAHIAEVYAEINMAAMQRTTLNPQNSGITLNSAEVKPTLRRFLKIALQRRNALVMPIGTAVTL